MLKEVYIKELIPNNFYLNELKVDSIRKAYSENNQSNLPPILVGLIDGECALLDGHSRTMVAFEQGGKTITAQVYPIEEIEGPTGLYIAINHKAKEMGLKSIEDLRNRVVSNEEHKKLWVEYCELMILGLSNEQLCIETGIDRKLSEDVTFVVDSHKSYVGIKKGLNV